MNFFGIFYGDYIYLVHDLYLIFCIIFIFCFGIYLFKNIKSLILSRLIVELSLPIFVFLILLSLCFFDTNIDVIYFFSFKLDMFNIFFRILILIILIIYFYYFRNIFFLERLYMFEYSILVLLSVEGTFLLLTSIDLFVIYLALELQNLGFYIMSSIYRYSNFSTEAGLKYFLLGSFSSSLFLYGLSILYGLFGTLNLFDLYLFMNVNYINSFIYFISIFFLFVSLIFKLGGAPFHWWLPDVYDGSPTVVTMYFSIIPKIIYICLIIKLIMWLFILDKFFFSVLFSVVGLFSLIFGIVNAMYQYRIKRFLAYSAIANIGYVFLVFGLCNFYSLFSSLFFIITYIISVMLIFIFLLSVKKINNYEFINIYELSLISNTNSLLSLFLVLIFISLAGIPPFIGFFGKFFIFIPFIYDYNYVLLIIILLFSVISSFYYIRIIRFIFFNKIDEYLYLKYFNSNVIFILLLLINLYFFLIFDIFAESLFFLLLNVFFF